MKFKKTYTKKEVNSLLRRQRNMSSIIPLLMVSGGMSREWNKSMRNLSKTLKSLPLVNK